MKENNGISDEKNADNPSEMRKIAKSYSSGWRYAEYAFQYGASIVLCSLAGYWLDNWLNTGNWLLIIGVLFGSVAGFINLLRGLNYKGPKVK
ncbi:MAG TPA: AtpZ/AtpI family protein [Ignavibacteria bacterium]|jgi:F0F1-type ATP synthase assembly protein I|nr:AtpZ/AtpI family protein [Ignavibacteria bacterium]